MSGGRAEQAIRALPGVVGCSVTAARVAVLLQPSADADEVGAQVASILRSEGLRLDVRVLGGTRAPAPVASATAATAATGMTAARAARGPRPSRPAATRTRRTQLVAGTAAGAAVLALGALVAALNSDDGAPELAAPTPSVSPGGGDSQAPSKAPASRVVDAVPPTTEATFGAVTAQPAGGNGDGRVVLARNRRTGSPVVRVRPAAAPAPAPAPPAPATPTAAAAPAPAPPPPAPAPKPSPSTTPAPAPSKPGTVVTADDDCAAPPPPRANRQSDRANGPRAGGTCEPPSRQAWPGRAGTPR